MAKRLLDVLIAAVGLAAAAPLMALIALGIMLDDGGPSLFLQTRVGKGRHPFRIYKFRTMRDGWITGIGRWLRATGLDELPQLVNVLRGDMSLIGPRPLTAADVTRLGWDSPAHDVRFDVRPGVIGLAQLYAGRGARLSWFLDEHYVTRRTAALDLGIVLLSAVIGVVGKRRVREWLRSRRRPVRPAAAVVRPAPAWGRDAPPAGAGAG